ncbi:MAG: LysR family transcriptional regulator [Rhizobiales bacterium]|nr:LysR family transcriptional regulator [Hyphomicrobiales bacterium]
MQVPYRRLPSLNSLRAFEATARQGSITRAAEELGVTQSAVSHQIKTLEAFTGTTLLARRGNRFSLTPAGQRTMSLLGEGFDLLADAVADLQSPEIRGEVIISCPPAITTLWLVKAITPFLSSHPGLRIGLRSSVEWKAVIGSDVDLCIRYGNGVWKNHQTILLREVELFPVCSPTVAKGLNSPHDLHKVPLLYANDDNDWETWFSCVRMSNMPQARHYMGNDFLSIETAAHGFGVAIGDDVTCQYYLNRGILVQPFPERKKSNRSFYLIERKRPNQSIAIRTVKEWILRNFGEDAGLDSISPA